MGTLYIGTKAIHTDDATGFYWDSPQKRFRLNQDGTPYEEVKEPEVTVSVAEVPEPVTETVIEPVKEDVFICEVCGYPAKSNAGLSAHKRKTH